MEAREDAAERTLERINRLLAYEEYLQSPMWREKRWRVLERCRGICEGCGNRGAREVHHLRYPRGCLPGSEQWVRREKLYDLVGLCEVCHGDVYWSWEKTRE